jgi:hypothetical protein
MSEQIRQQAFDCQTYGRICTRERRQRAAVSTNRQLAVDSFDRCQRAEFRIQDFTRSGQLTG